MNKKNVIGVLLLFIYALSLYQFEYLRTDHVNDYLFHKAKLENNYESVAIIYNPIYYNNYPSLFHKLISFLLLILPLNFLQFTYIYVFVIIPLLFWRVTESWVSVFVLFCTFALPYSLYNCVIIQLSVTILSIFYIYEKLAVRRIFYGLLMTYMHYYGFFVWGILFISTMLADEFKKFETAYVFRFSHLSMFYYSFYSLIPIHLIMNFLRSYHYKYFRRSLFSFSAFILTFFILKLQGNLGTVPDRIMIFPAVIYSSRIRHLEKWEMIICLFYGAFMWYLTLIKLNLGVI